MLENLLDEIDPNQPSVSPTYKYLLLDTEFLNDTILSGFHITALVSGTINISVCYYSLVYLECGL